MRLKHFIVVIVEAEALIGKISEAEVLGQKEKEDSSQKFESLDLNSVYTKKAEAEAKREIKRFAMSNKSRN